MSDTDFVFSAAALAATPDLVFGADTTLRTAQFAITLDPPSGGFVVEQEIPADAITFAVTLAPPSGTLTFEHDPNIPSYLGAQAGAPWQGAAGIHAHGGVAWVDGARLSDEKTLPWQQGDTRRPASQSIPWQHGDARRPASQSIPWRDGDARRPASQSIPWRDGLFAEQFAAVPWRDGRQVRTEHEVSWRDGKLVLLPKAMPWRDGKLVLLPKGMPWRHGLLVETHGNNPWPPVVPPEVAPCYESSPNLAFERASPATTDLVFACDFHTPGGPAASVIVPIRSAYIVVNNVSLAILDGPALHALSLSMSLDADSWTWRWSATLPGIDLVHVDTGAPVEVVAAVNGTVYRLVVEHISRERSFGRNEVRVSGRGRNAVLDVLSGNHANSEVRTAAQLMDDALLVGGDGWTVDFGLDDWLVPAGVWSAQGTAMNALNMIAAAAGGYVQPHRTNAVVRVLPRYAAAPWTWASVVPDFELPSAVTKREAIEWVRKAAYNRVFVSGTRDGILAQVTREGTAGDVVAPMVTDALIAAVEAGRQRGLAILSDTGQQQLLSLSLPVLPETGVIEPGKFVRYVDGAVERVGVVRSTNIEARFPSLQQTLGVETHVE